MFDFVEYSFENLLYLYTQWKTVGLLDDALLWMTALNFLPYILAIACVFEVVKSFFSFCCSLCKSKGRD